ncbi:uncharacterized protein LOC124436284 isoform X2 [Xenia sp. Carnegie-2017]|uniref:uncharacterized protein LOC124436284 isoform X2 n=1 Tax=Xenia sp. Carnegie-2017 TaxID=2897299 RepID=UPI001F04F0D2|nr:uncharacterized protein LOC124436284 isoform X2 [Xenia sp. Carnegie-2017]
MPIDRQTASLFLTSFDDVLLNMAAKGVFCPTTPASVIYAQSWHVPSSKHASKDCFPSRSNNHEKDFVNSPWIVKQKKVKASVKPKFKHSKWIENHALRNYDVLDSVNELKFTLEMFKKLTNQVEEVDEQLNSRQKIYTFKHFITKNYHEGKIELKTPEIPMTNEDHQPCTNLEFRKDQKRQLPIRECFQKTIKTKPKKGPNLTEKGFLTQNSFPDKQNEAVNCDENKGNFQDYVTQMKHLDDECASQDNFSDADSKTSSMSSVSHSSNEDVYDGLSYIDPVYYTLEMQKYHEHSKEHDTTNDSYIDPFINRYLILRQLQTETVKQEVAITFPRDQIHKKFQKKNDLEIPENKCKTQTRNIKKPNKYVMCDSGMAKEINNGKRYIRGMEFGKASQKTKQSKENQVSTTKNNSQKKGGHNLETGKRSKSPKTRKVQKQVESCKIYPSRYLPTAITYDIVELAETFDPPCKEKIKMKSRPLTAKSAKHKGMIPGKSRTSQRQYSLTSGQNVREILSFKLSNNSQDSSAKSGRNVKRCASSKF